MPIRIRCPNCNSPAQVPDSSLGKTAKCKCGASFAIEPAEAIPSLAENASGQTVQKGTSDKGILYPDIRRIRFYAALSVCVVSLLALLFFFGFKVLLVILALAATAFGLWSWKSRRAPAASPSALGTMNFCGGCGQPWKSEYKFCPNCGHNPHQESEREPAPVYAASLRATPALIPNNAQEQVDRPRSGSCFAKLFFIGLAAIGLVYLFNSNGTPARHTLNEIRVVIAPEKKSSVHYNQQFDPTSVLLVPAASETKDWRVLFSKAQSRLAELGNLKKNEQEAVDTITSFGRSIESAKVPGQREGRLEWNLCKLESVPAGEYWLIVMPMHWEERVSSVGNFVNGDSAGMICWLIPVTVREGSGTQTIDLGTLNNLGYSSYALKCLVSP